MITDTFLIILNWFIFFIISLLPTWTPWPPELLEGLNYFTASLAKLNFIFPIDTLFGCITLLVSFEILYFGSKIVMKIFNFIRGTGSGLDI